MNSAGSLSFREEDAVSRIQAVNGMGVWGGVVLSLFFSPPSSIIVFARVLPHGAPNNCHQVQSGNGLSEMRPGGGEKKKSQREASVGSPFFVLV